MKMYLISDNIDTWTGMRLAGVEGAVVHGKEELKAELDKVLADKTIGIVLLTEKFGRGAWDTPAIIAFTCVLGVFTASWVISDLFHMKKESTDCFYKIAAEAPETA